MREVSLAGLALCIGCPFLIGLYGRDMGDAMRFVIGVLMLAALIRIGAEFVNWRAYNDPSPALIYDPRGRDSQGRAFMER